jgi:alpha/beta superfamily hydrolase
MSEIAFRGAQGKVDGFYSHSRNSNAPAVLIVSNNNDKPTKKGSSLTKIVDMVFDVFVANDFSVLRFDFVGHKVDKNDVDNSNLLDMTAALDWLHAKNFECRSFWVCGVDYGAFVTLQLVMRRPELENYVLVSPNMKKNDMSFIIPCSACGLIVRGSEDIKFTEDECLALQEKLLTKAESKVKCTTIYGAERDFANEIEQLGGELSSYLEEKTAYDRKNLRHITAGKRRRRKKRSSYLDEDRPVYINPVKNLEIRDI